MLIIYWKAHILNNSSVLMQITDPDCYKLVTNVEVSSTTPEFTTMTTFTRITSNKPGSV